MYAMKGVAVLAVIGIVHVLVWQRATLRLTEAEHEEAGRQIAAGELAAADRRLRSSGAHLTDLATLPRLVVLPSHERRRAALSKDVGEAGARLDAALATLSPIFDTLAGPDRGASHDKAEALARQALSQAPDDRTLALSLHYLERVAVQDFKSAEEHLRNLLANLPASVDIAGINSVLTRVIQQEQQARDESHARVADAVTRRARRPRVRDAATWTPTLRGKAMVWDAGENSVARVFDELPDRLRASWRDRVVTMFYVERPAPGEGSSGGGIRSAPEPYMRVTVLYWPEMTTPGVAVFRDAAAGARPGGGWAVRSAEGIDAALEQWIIGLPAPQISSGPARQVK